MKTRFATPQERDLRFIRDSKLRPDDFGQEVKIISSMVDAAALVGIFLVVLYFLPLAG